MNEYQQNPELTIFLNQAFVATSWIRGNPVLFNSYVSRMIESVGKGSQTLEQAAGEAQGQINQILERLSPATP